MIKSIYVMRDQKSGVYGSPITHYTDATITRDISSALKSDKPTMDFQQYPSDFDLYKIGSFDTDSGKIIANDPIHVIALASLQEVKIGN